MAFGGRTAFSKDCEDGLAKLGTTGAALSAAAWKVGFKNGMSSGLTVAQAYGDPVAGSAAQVAWSVSLHDALGEAGDATVSDIFVNNAAITAWTPYKGNTIYISAFRLNTASAVQNQGFIMHELLHNLYGKDDGDIQDALGISGPSVAISNWMRDYCVSGEGNR